MQRINPIINIQTNSYLELSKYSNADFRVRTQVCTWPDRGELFLQNQGAAPRSCHSWSGVPSQNGTQC